MQEFCVHERHGGICAKTGAYCNLGACPYEDLQKFAPVRHGRWLTWEEQFPAHIPSKKSGLGVFCSTCHKHADNMYDYCPNCGAKMDGGTP